MCVFLLAEEGKKQKKIFSHMAGFECVGVFRTRGIESSIMFLLSSAIG